MSISETHTLSGQPIKIRSFIKLAAATAKVFPAKVVNQNEYDVGLVHSLTAIRKLQFIGSSVRVRLNRPRPKHLVFIWYTPVRPDRFPLPWRCQEVRDTFHFAPGPLSPSMIFGLTSLNGLAAVLLEYR